MKKYLIIVAGGEGKRMNSETPKQFIDICDKPVIVHTIDVFKKFLPELIIIVVIHPKYKYYWENTLSRFSHLSQCLYTEGGPQRFYSVKNGLAQIEDNHSIVGIHDAVRPFVSENVVKNAFKEAEISGNAVPVIKINESIRKKNGSFNEPVNRENLFIVQTPQCFQTQLIKKAYAQNYHENFTDDATVLESIGEKIRLIDGNPENIKITLPSDLLIAEAFLKNRD